MLSHKLDHNLYVIVVDFNAVSKHYTLLFIYVNGRSPAVETFPQEIIEHFYRMVNRSE